MSAQSFLYCLLCLKVLLVVSADEFCSSEIFQPQCLHNEVIYITKALYGRREYGRCLKNEGDLDEYLVKKPGYINCSTDVRHIIEPQCAGQQRCEVIVSSIKGNTSCLNFVLKHLEASHECIRDRFSNREFEIVPCFKRSCCIERGALER